MHAKLLQARTCRVQVADVHCVAVEQAGAPQALAVVIDGHRAVDDLVTAIAIDVGDAQLVVALAAEGFVAGRGAVEQPALGQLAVAPVPGRQGRATIVAASHDNAGSLAVQIGRASQEAVGAVGVAVAPDLGHLLDRGRVGARVALGRVGGAGQGLAGRAFEDGQELGTLQQPPLDAGDSRAVRLDLGAGAVGLRPLAAALAPVDIGIAQDLAGSVHSPVAGAHRQLGLAVAVVVEDLELGVVGASPDIAA